MVAVISSTYDSKYLFFIPIVTYCWNKLGVDVICFMPEYALSPIRFEQNEQDAEMRIKKQHLLYVTFLRNELKCEIFHFDAPEHKEATYAQCSRLYASAIKDLPEDEILITSDVDMALFKNFPADNHKLCIFGSDLVPSSQYPMCYITGTVKTWREVFNIYGYSYQEHLDMLLGGIEAEHFRGNYWAKDQEEAFKIISPTKPILHSRSNGQNQFATKRVDRDDYFWRDRLNLDVIDAHLWRPGYEENNFQNILEILRYFYPHDNLDWLKKYRDEYIKLL